MEHSQHDHNNDQLLMSSPFHLTVVNNEFQELEIKKSIDHTFVSDRMEWLNIYTCDDPTCS
jgi:hypothetical protein